MALLVLENAGLSFADQPILANAGLHLTEGDRIGLIGPNGSGKSTLMRVLMGRQTLDEGEARRARNCRIGYLPQDILELAGDSILGSVLAAVPGREQNKQRLAAVQAALETTADTTAQMTLAHELSELHAEFDRFESLYTEHRAHRILLGLGFSEGDFDRSTETLSGGWKMRAALAGLLFQDPDVLFLDEPTNHLDVPTVAWLGQFLNELRAALVLVCHDREFLNRHIDRVVSFEPEGLRSYRGNYDAYLLQRTEEEKILEAQAANRERKVKELERFVERFRAKATKARQAQSRAKQIEKLQAEIDAPIARPRRLSFNFPKTARSGKDVMSLEQIGKRYGELVVYHGLSKNVYAGDRIAIVGPNGIGKTTLLRIMAGELPIESGHIRYGANVDVGYYAQHHTELLHPSRTVLEEVWAEARQLPESSIRGICGAFLFSNDTVEKPIRILSGGERARVLLARLLVKPGNLLLMDEPTNHLDLHAAEALGEALASFDGTLVFVSHNIGFVNRLATKIWDVEQHSITEYLGNLDDYFRLKAADQEAQALEQAASQDSNITTDAQQNAALAAKSGNISAGERKEQKRRQAEQRNALNKKTRTTKKEIDALEQRIQGLEAEQQDLEQQLADPKFYQQKDVFRASFSAFEQNRTKLQELYARWEHKQEQLATLLD